MINRLMHCGNQNSGKKEQGRCQQETCSSKIRQQVACHHHLPSSSVRQVRVASRTSSRQ